MKSALLPVLLSATVALAGFGPAVRVDHENLPNHMCYQCAMTIGAGAPSGQPLYVVFEDDSMVGPASVRPDIMFQKSTDAGRTWLPTDLLIRRGAPRAEYPDITTDSDGNVYIVYKDVYDDTAGAGHSQVSCVFSSDGGATWSAPARVDDSMNAGIGWAQIAADSAGNLFVAWNQFPGGFSHVYSSVSTDKGATWSPRVRVDDTLTDEECYHEEVFVQPGTNHYLVAGYTYRWVGSHIRPCAYLYRSTDHGQTFQPGVQLDTFNDDAFDPHVVADRDHIICDYFGSGRNVPADTIIAEARTFYTQADTWGTPCPVTSLDSLHELYYSGTLALSGDGRVHTALMVEDTALFYYNIYYASSSDHGVTWSDIELVQEDTTGDDFYPDIVTDMAGHAYVVWQHVGIRSEIWFSTNNPAGIAEEPMQQRSIGVQPSATMIRNVLLLTEASSHKPQAASLLDISGRQVMALKPGANDVRALAPGVYFVREAQAQAEAVRKIVVTR